MIATLMITRQQLKEMQRSSAGQNILALVNYLQAQAVRDARTVVRKQLKNKPFDQWTEEERRQADIVCATYDVVSVLIFQQRIAPAEPFVENWGPSIRDCFETLRGYIHHMQSPERSGPSYWNDFSVLYDAAVAHSKK